MNKGRLAQHLMTTNTEIVLVEAFDTHLLATPGLLLAATHFMYVPSAVMYIVPFARGVRDYLPLSAHETELSQLIAAHRRIGLKG